MPDGARWSRDDHLLAFDLYCRTPFGRMHHRNPEVVSLARLLDRTSGSVALELVNFARLDPSLQSRGIGGMSHGAKGEVAIWREFVDDPEGLAVEAATLKGTAVDEPAGDEDVVPPIGRDALGPTKRRIGQRFFRTAVLAAYDDRWCVTGLSIPSLLMASHIVGWADDARHRTNPRNGLFLNALHDRAFDRLIMYFDDDCRVRFARHRFDVALRSDSGAEWLLSFEGRPMREPKRFLPDPELLAIHRERALTRCVGGGASSRPTEPRLPFPHDGTTAEGADRLHRLAAHVLPEVRGRARPPLDNRDAHELGPLRPDRRRGRPAAEAVRQVRGLSR